MGFLHRARATSISSIRVLRFFRLMRLIASLLITTLLQKGFIAADRLPLTRPPGGQKAQHRTSVSPHKTDLHLDGLIDVMIYY